MKSYGRHVFIYALLSFCLIFTIFYKFDAIPGSSSIDYSSLTSIERFKFMKIKEAVDRITENEIQATVQTKIDKTCECKSEKSGKSYDFCYKNPKNTSLIGKRFDCVHLKKLEDLKIIDSPEQSLVDLANPSRNAEDVMYVSAISANHFGNFKEAYALIKKHWPNQKIILYSLDLDDSKIKQLEADPNIKVKKFDYSQYPAYVKNWMEYRFKALILAEALRDYSNVWWIDAHTRWINPKPLDKFYGELADCTKDPDCEKKSSLMMFINSTHSNYAVLTTGLLDYFPTYGLDTLKTNEKGLQLSAMFVYLARTPFTLDIIKWHTLCALEEKCMNPPAAKLKCDIIPRWGDYAGCFRYDQSSINILMFNAFRDHNDYYMNVGELSRTYAHY